MAERIKARLLADPTLTNQQLQSCIGCSSELIALVRKEIGIPSDKKFSGLLSLEETQAAIKKLGINLEPQKVFLRRPPPRVKQEPES